MLAKNKIIIIIIDENLKRQRRDVRNVQYRDNRIFLFVLYYFYYYYDYWINGVTAFFFFAILIILIIKLLCLNERNLHSNTSKLAIC